MELSASECEVDFLPSHYASFCHKLIRGRGLNQNKLCIPLRTHSTSGVAQSLDVNYRVLENIRVWTNSFKRTAQGYRPIRNAL